MKLIEQESVASKPEYAQLCGLFRKLTQGDDFKKLEALANTVKHRSIIRPELNEDATGKRLDKHILKLESFWYAGHFFEAMDAHEFMQREHDRMQPLTVDIGVELNEVLRLHVDSQPTISSKADSHGPRA